ncbi:hypothetical protein BSKO_12956 [Bryopsis sp. KO-2023]|nr:hypothetical protein BSKO_12956 [Bryopsis sp. KO-2023]
MPKGSAKVYKVRRQCNPLEPVYPWKFEGEPTIVPSSKPTRQPLEAKHNRTTQVSDIQGTSSSKRYSRKNPVDPLDYSDVHGSTANHFHHTWERERDGRIPFEDLFGVTGTSGRFRSTRTPTNPTDPAYRIHSRRVQMEGGGGRVNQTMNRDESGLERLVNGGGGEGEIVGRIEQLKSNNLNSQQAKPRYQGMGVKHVFSKKPFATVV